MWLLLKRRQNVENESETELHKAGLHYSTQVMLSSEHSFLHFSLQILMLLWKYGSAQIKKKKKPCILLYANQRKFCSGLILLHATSTKQVILITESHVSGLQQNRQHKKTKYFTEKKMNAGSVVRMQRVTGSVGFGRHMNIFMLLFANIIKRLTQ